MHQLDKDLIYSAYVRSKERGWGRGGRSQSIGASEIGMCARRTWHLKRNTPKDAIFQDSYGAMERGNLVEEFWVRAMRHTFGSRLKGAGNEQRRLPKGYISCTPDGCLTDLPRDFLKPYGVDDIGEDGSILTDCKSFGSISAPKPAASRARKSCARYLSAALDPARPSLRGRKREPVWYLCLRDCVSAFPYRWLPLFAVARRSPRRLLNVDPLIAFRIPDDEREVIKV
jgi:hypothetical protein